LCSSPRSIFLVQLDLFRRKLFLNLLMSLFSVTSNSIIMPFYLQYFIQKSTSDLYENSKLYVFDFGLIIEDLIYILQCNLNFIAKFYKYTILKDFQSLNLFLFEE